MKRVISRLIFSVAVLIFAGQPSYAGFSMTTTYQAIGTSGTSGFSCENLCKKQVKACVDEENTSEYTDYTQCKKDWYSCIGACLKTEENLTCQEWAEEYYWIEKFIACNPSRLCNYVDLFSRYIKIVERGAAICNYMKMNLEMNEDVADGSRGIIKK